MFKRYDDAPNHWAVFIPIPFTGRRFSWHPQRDVIVYGPVRKHLVFTWKSEVFAGNNLEVRIRIGLQYL
jgi:hypothetical protein